MTDAAAGATRFVHVIALDGAVTSVTQAVVSAALGVELDLADGTHATVLFGDSDIGASITWVDGSTPVYSATPGAGVATLPLTAP